MKEPTNVVSNVVAPNCESLLLPQDSLLMQNHRACHCQRWSGHAQGGQRFGNSESHFLYLDSSKRKMSRKKTNGRKCPKSEPHDMASLACWIEAQQARPALAPKGQILPHPRLFDTDTRLFSASSASTQRSKSHPRSNWTATRTRFPRFRHWHARNAVISKKCQ